MGFNTMGLHEDFQPTPYINSHLTTKIKQSPYINSSTKINDHPHKFARTIIIVARANFLLQI